MAVAPIEFPPPVDPAAEFIGAPTDPEDERIEVGVAIVGIGIVIVGLSFKPPVPIQPMKAIGTAAISHKMRLMTEMAARWHANRTMTSGAVG